MSDLIRNKGYFAMDLFWLVTTITFDQRSVHWGSKTFVQWVENFRYLLKTFEVFEIQDFDLGVKTFEVFIADTFFSKIFHTLPKVQDTWANKN